MSDHRHRYVIAGAGGIGSAAAVLLAALGQEDCDLVLWDADQATLQRAAATVPQGRKVRNLDTVCGPAGEDSRELLQVLGSADVLLDCLPGSAIVAAATLALRHGLHYANLTAHVAETAEIQQLARGAATAFVLQTGLAPGFVNVVACRMVRDFCRDFEVETVDRVKMRVGALTEHAQAPHFYAFTWSPVGVAKEYLDPAVVVRDFAVTRRPSLSERETLILDGVQYEEALTSGGAADLPEALASRVRDLDYKTLRYPGHWGWVEGLLATLPPQGDERVSALQDLMERSVPHSEDDRVVIYASVEGDDRRGVPHLREAVYQVRPTVLDGVRLRAIQTTTAAPLVEVAHLLLQGGYKGPVLQSQLDPDAFLSGPVVSAIYG